MRFRALAATALAVPLLAACGGTSSTADPGDAGATATSTVSATGSASATGPTSAANPGGPVLDGDSFTLTLPPGAHIQKHNIASGSYGWDMGDDWSLDGTAIDMSCGSSCEEDTAATRDVEAKYLLRDRRSDGEKRLPDVTVGGITMVHTSGGHGTQLNEQYGARYRGRDYRFVFEIDLGSGTRQHVDALIQQILASVTFKD